MKISYRSILLTTFSFLVLGFSFAQPLKKQKIFTHADTLRGFYGIERNWWDVLKYDLHLSFNLSDSSISGYNTIQFKQIGPSKSGILQIDLQSPLMIDSILYTNWSKSSIACAYTKDGNAYMVQIPKHAIGVSISNAAKEYLTIYYHGKPRIAVRPPWDGGLIMKKDKYKNPWVTIACQGLGASIWYPCKDHQADEPDSAEMHIRIPDSLYCVGNGQFRGKTLFQDETASYDWAVTNPINNYCLIPYIGKYVHFNEIYQGEKGPLNMDYWVLEYNLEKAKIQFKDAPRMMKAFEYWFGPYPFYEDGYKLVDAPHLGMEHQSATAYGNGYQNGYHGTDLSESGWGLKWDFIIVHESGHEWFANNITTKDIADMWVHEGFTNYSETLFTDYWYGKEAGNAYVQGTRKLIQNDIPIIGHYNVNQEGSGDMYYKGGNLLHTIRQIVNDDDKFRKILRGLNKVFYHQTVTTQQVEQYIIKESKIDFSKVFNQYLRTTNIPVLEYKIKGYDLSYRYTNCIKEFKMPIKISFKTVQWIKPTTDWQTLSLYPEGNNSFSVDPNFYIKTKKLD